MHKLLAIPLAALALAACTSTATPPSTMGNPAETKNSTDANKTNNPAAVSPGGASPGAGAGAGAGAGTGAAPGTK